MLGVHWTLVHIALLLHRKEEGQQKRKMSLTPLPLCKECVLYGRLESTISLTGYRADTRLPYLLNQYYWWQYQNINSSGIVVTSEGDKQETTPYS